MGMAVGLGVKVGLGAKTQVVLQSISLLPPSLSLSPKFVGNGNSDKDAPRTEKNKTVYTLESE
jgi:hypothetical protein